MITIQEVFAFFTTCFFYQFFTVNRFGIHSNQCSHAVTTVNVQSLCNRAKAVSSVNVTTMFHVVAQTPSQFVFFTVLPVVRPEVIQVVDVSTLSAENFTEYSVLSHVQCVHFKPVIAAVFQNHTVFTSLFRQVDQFPALFQIHC